MRILVTGGAGYVGSATVRHLLSVGHDVAVVDDLSQGRSQSIPDNILTVCGIEDRRQITTLVRGCDAVLHFAASAAVGESVANPRLYYRNNVAGSLALLETLVDCGVRHLVFSSTCATYSETDEMPLRESSAIAPISPYAFTKYAIERMIADFARAYGLRFALLRYFNAAGASPDGQHGEDHRPETHLIPIVFQTLLGKRRSVSVFGRDYPTPDGTCIRDYVHVDDLAQAHLQAVEWTCGKPASSGEIFNLGTGTGHSVLEVLGAVERVTGKQVPFEWAARRPGDTAKLVAAPDKACDMLKWRPAYARLEDTIATAWEWHRHHRDGYSS